MMRLESMAAAACVLGIALWGQAATTAPATTQAAGTAAVLQTGQTQADLRAYLLGCVRRFVAPSDPHAWERQADRLRAQVLDEVIFRGVPADWREGPTRVVWGQTLPAQGYSIRKLRYEVVPGLWAGALLYEPADLKGRRPGVLNPNGHVGEPGMTIGYKQERCINLARRGMIALSTKFIGMGQLRGPGTVHNEAAHLDLCGTAGVSVFYLALKRGLDILAEHPAVDPARIAVTGLSGGGWQTILISSLDERVGLAAPNAGYISFEERIWNAADIGDLEQNPADLLTVADYVELTAMLFPRPALLIYNEKDDCCFRSPRAIQAVYRPVRPLYEVAGLADRFAFHVNADPGTHNYLKDNREAFYRFINAHFLPADERRDEEIPAGAETRPADELAIGYPETNADFHTLAAGLTGDLPRRPRPADPAAQEAWRQETRRRLAEVLRLDETAGAIDTPVPFAGAQAWRLRIGGRWTVPVVEYVGTSKRPHGVTVILADGGRADAPGLVADALRRGRWAVVVDLLLLGECRPVEGTLGQWAMMLSAAGRRALGVQVSQLQAVLDWLDSRRAGEPVELAATGRMAGLAAVVTAAMNPGRCEAVRVAGLEVSLKECVRARVRYDEAPSLFCFGLLETADLPELAALAEPSRVEWMPASTAPGPAAPR